MLPYPLKHFLSRDMFTFIALCSLLVIIVADQDMTVQITPEQAVRRVGENITILCKVNYPLNYCRMILGGTMAYLLEPYDESGDVIYRGNGLQSGECGALIKNIRAEWRGGIKCLLFTTSYALVSATMNLSVIGDPPHIDMTSTMTPIDGALSDDSGAKVLYMCLLLPFIIIYVIIRRMLLSYLCDACCSNTEQDVEL